MRVLVTGGAGFIGSHVVDRLVEHRHSVTALDNLSTGNKANVNPAAAFSAADVTNAVEILAVVGTLQPDAIIHLAAQVSVTHSLTEPSLDANVNIIGTLNLLQAARKLPNPPRFVFASSGGAVYGDASDFPSTETTPPNPATPYGVAKLAGEHYVRLLSPGTHVILRFSNVYGPRQGTSKETGVCAVFVRQSHAGEPLTVFGDGSQTRDYIFVADVARAVLTALGKGNGEVVNISSGIETSSADLARRVASIAGKGSISHLPARAGDVQRSWLSCSKARHILDWAPEVGLEAGLAATLSHGLARAPGKDDSPASGGIKLP